MSWISVDVESDGQYPGFGEPPLAKDQWGYSMIAIGAVLVAKPEVGFLGYLQPISGRWQPDALAVAEWMRADIASRSLAGLNVTVSLGAATHRSGETVTHLFARADQHLYEAKRAGRNRVR